MGKREDAYREAARRMYQYRSDGDIDLDYGDAPKVSESARGAYVAAWVFVYADEAGLEPLEGEEEAQ